MLTVRKPIAIDACSVATPWIPKSSNIQREKVLSEKTDFFCRCSLISQF